MCDITIIMCHKYGFHRFLIKHAPKLTFLIGIPGFIENDSSVPVNIKRKCHLTWNLSSKCSEMTFLFIDVIDLLVKKRHFSASSRFLMDILLQIYEYPYGSKMRWKYCFNTIIKIKMSMNNEINIKIKF